MSLDFTGLAASLLSHSAAILQEWLPAGKWEGREYCIGDLSGAAGSSLKINADTGVWRDFAGDDGGADLISLYAALHDISQGEAAKRLSNGSAPAQITPPRKAAKAVAIIPVPATAPTPPDIWWHKGPDGKTWESLTAIARWPYYTADGLAGFTCRFECYDSGMRLQKEIVPQIFAEVDGEHKWAWRSLPAPRPLYNLPELLRREFDPVLIVEGEKKVDALRTLAPQYVGIAWAGGAQAWKKSDWSVLRKRQILLWPDNDEPGRKCMLAIGMSLLRTNASVKIIMPSEVIEKFDAADALADGWTWETFKQWAVPRITVLTEGGKHEHESSRAAAFSGSGIAGIAGGSQLPIRADTADANVRHDDGRSAGAEEGRYRTGNGDAEAAQATQRQGPDQAQAEHHRGDDSASTPARQSGQAQATQPQTQVERWLAYGLHLTAQGAPLTNLDNAVRCMESDPSLRALVWFDEFLGRMLTADPPREWSDADDINLTLYLQRDVGLSKLSRDTVSQAVVSCAYRDRRNCVQDWVKSLTWDGTARMETFFSDIFGAEDTAYSRAVGRNFWVSIAARAFRPGCQLKNMVVLEGAQGLGKSPAVQIIGGEWYAAQHESAINPKAFAEVLQGKLIIEIEEMDAFSRADLTSIKRSVSCQSDRFRQAYGRHAQDHPRTIVMIGTTNKDNWNRDDTGADRFWPIRCHGSIRLDLLTGQREQLFAEAYAALQDGARYWEMPREETKAEQDKRFDGDPWLEPISEYLDGREMASVNEILTGLFDVKVGELIRGDQMRVATCLTFLGWSNGGNMKIGGKVRKIWHRTPQSKFSQQAVEDRIEMANRMLSGENDAE